MTQESAHSSMEHGLRLVLYLLYFIEYLSFHFVIFHHKLVCQTKWGWYVAGIVVLTNVAFWITPTDSILEYCLLYAGVFIGIGMLFGGRFKQQIKEFLLAFLTISILQSGVDNIIFYLTSWKLLYLEMAAVSCVCIILWAYYLFYGKRHPFGLNISDKIWWLVVTIFFVLVFMFEFYAFILKNIEIKPMVNGLMTVVTSVSGILICFLIYAILIYENHMRQARMQNDLLEAFQEQQRQYFQGMMDKEYETRRFRHNIINELMQLKQYSQDGENEKLAAYLDEMMGQVSVFSKRYDVGNEIVNTILNYYFTPLAENIRLR